MEGTGGEASGWEVVYSEEEVSDRSQPYIPEWPHVIRGSNLATQRRS